MNLQNNAEFARESFNASYHASQDETPRRAPKRTPAGIANVRQISCRTNMDPGDCRKLARSISEFDAPSRRDPRVEAVCAHYDDVRECNDPASFEDRFLDALDAGRAKSNASQSDSDDEDDGDYDEDGYPKCGWYAWHEVPELRDREEQQEARDASLEFARHRRMSDLIENARWNDSYLRFRKKTRDANRGIVRRPKEERSRDSIRYGRWLEQLPLDEPFDFFYDWEFDEYDWEFDEMLVTETLPAFVEWTESDEREAQRAIELEEEDEEWRFGIADIYMREMHDFREYQFERRYAEDADRAVKYYCEIRWCVEDDLIDSQIHSLECYGEDCPWMRDPTDTSKSYFEDLARRLTCA